MTTKTLANILVECGVVTSFKADEQNIIMLGRISEAATMIAAEQAKEVSAWKTCAESLHARMGDESRNPLNAHLRDAASAEFDRLKFKL